MCVICVKPSGVKMPTYQEIKNMWERNPDGAGYILNRDGYVKIRKGFMDLSSFVKAIVEEKITIQDVVIMHFRISTQGGINGEMTHPFALSDKLEDMKELNVLTDIGVAHNGIIKMTSDGDKEYSDTAKFIADYMSKIIRDKDDIYDAKIQKIIGKLIESKMAILTNDGKYVLIGEFIEKDGLYFSNMFHDEDYYFDYIGFQNMRRNNLYSNASRSKSWKNYKSKWNF